MFDIKFFTLLIFIVINFIIIFFVRSRTTSVISLIVSHLIVILLLSNIISSYEVLKEIILSLALYSIVLLFLISNYNQTAQKQETERNSLPGIPPKAIVIFITILLIFLGMFFLSKNILRVKKEIVGKTLSTVQIENNLQKTNHLEDNFLLKKSSDIILLIVAASSILLILSKKEQ